MRKFQHETLRKMSLPFLSPFLAFLVSFLLLQAFLRHDIAQAVLDQPNERSLHQHPVPRIGGIALMAGVGVGWIAVGGPNAWLLLAFAGALVVVSALDDVACQLHGDSLRTP